MIARPILFSAPMVLAILRGGKFETRRLMNPQPTWSSVPELVDDWEWKSPYGDPGDRLWVKETHCFRSTESIVGPKLETFYRADGEPLWKQNDGVKWRPSIFMPRWASRITLEVVDSVPERLSAITEDSAIREGISRLSKDGGTTYKYGIPDRDGWPGTDDFGWRWSDWKLTARAAFFELWDKINGKKALCVSDPFVWKTTFRIASGGAP